MKPFAAIKEFIFLTTLIASVSLGAWEMAYGAEVDANTSRGNWQVDATAIQISAFPGSVVVKAERRADIKITVSRVAETSSLSLPTVNVRSDGTAIVEQAPANTPSTELSEGIKVGSAGSSIVVINGVVIKGGASNLSLTGVTSQPTLTAVVPVGTPVAILGQRFEVSVGNTQGPLEVETSADLTAGAVTSTRLDASGNASVVVARVTGEIDFVVRGNADVRVSDGEIDMVSVQAQGNSEVQIDARAIDARVAASGNASVDLASVREAPRLTIAGNADVVVGE